MQQDQGILDNLSTSIIALDRELRVIAVNASGEALLETSEARCIGVHAGQLVAMPDSWIESLRQVLTTNSPMAQRGVPLHLLSGQEIHVEADPVKSVWCDGEPFGHTPTTISVEPGALQILTMPEEITS